MIRDFENMSLDDLLLFAVEVTRKEHTLSDEESQLLQSLIITRTKELRTKLRSQALEFFVPEE